MLGIFGPKGAIQIHHCIISIINQHVHADEVNESKKTCFHQQTINNSNHLPFQLHVNNRELFTVLAREITNCGYS